MALTIYLTLFSFIFEKTKVKEVEEKLSKAAPLVFAGEVRTLQEELAKASSGQGFLLMGGDCAEVFKIIIINFRHSPKNYLMWRHSASSVLIMSETPSE